MDDPDDSDFGAGNTVNQVVRISAKNQFARRTWFLNSSSQREAGKQFGLVDDLVHHLHSGNGIVDCNVGVYCKQVAL